MREKRKSTEKKEENLSKADTADVMTKTNTHVILVANVSETELIRQGGYHAVSQTWKNRFNGQ